MLLHDLLKRVIKYGTLSLTDSSGKKHVISGASKPEIGIRLNTKSMERRLCFQPELALGEGYMNGEIILEKGDIYDLLDLIGMNLRLKAFSPLQSLTEKIAYQFRSLQQYNPIHRSRRNVAHHYDLPRELYELFLDKDMQYSCAYFRDTQEDLETAQENKKRHLVAKLKLEPGAKVLDIGSGWGGLALYMAQETGADVTGLTLSEEQHKVATERAAKAGLSDRVRFHLRDYREENNAYDRIISVGMFEHVGIKHYPAFFAQIRSLLLPEGIALLHSIGCSSEPSTANAWLNKYIFPGGYSPSLSETLQAIEPSGLSVTDIEILHHHYAETLRHWRMRFQANREKVKDLLDERFCRMWEYYLASCEIAFRYRGYMVFQMQIVKDISAAPLTRDYITDWERVS